MFKRVDANKDWLRYSIASCCFFGVANFVIGDLASKYGYTG
jgi:hypothetical protein